MATVLAAVDMNSLRSAMITTFMDLYSTHLCCGCVCAVSRLVLVCVCSFPEGIIIVLLRLLMWLAAAVGFGAGVAVAIVCPPPRRNVANAVGSSVGFVAWEAPSRS